MMDKKLNPTRDKYRILLVIRWPVGGIRTFLRYVYNNFDSSLYSITILAPFLPETKVLLEDLKGFDIDFIPLENKPSGMKFFKLITKTIIFERFDLIHSHGFTAGIYSALPAFLSRTKHIMTSHDILLEEQFKGLMGYLKRKVLSAFLPMINVIHSVSNDANGNLLKFIPSLSKQRDKCIVVSNGIDTKRFKGAEKTDLRKELNLSEDTFLIGFLGRFMSQKGFIYLIEALGILLKRTDLPKKPVVLAFGHGGFIREDAAYIEQKGLEGSFRFLPFAANIAPILKGLDAIVMPSLWEACGLLAMEAMVAGVPVIGTNCIGLREVLKDTPSVMVPAGDGIALAQILEHEIKNPSRLKAEAFVEEASKRFDVRKQSAELEKLILKLLAEEEISSYKIPM